MFYKSFLFLIFNALFWTINAKHGKSYYSNADLPTLTLPWGTYRGELYGDEEQTVRFSNVRFAKPPVGPLRFAAPQYPDAIENNKEIQDSSVGANCIQAFPPAKNSGVTTEPPPESTQSEDCLFLDIYVPRWVLEEESDEQLPVIVYIYGGAYIFGGKNTTFNTLDGPYSAYDGTGIRKTTDNGVIWVTGNYRLGAFGFLGGSYMEQNAQPNAGLHDQRLLLDWVQRYISQVNGDKNAVSVWGLSAGGGSILHHLVAYGGAKETSLFKRAAIWSPSYQWSYDRAGVLQETFFEFTTQANCADEDALECLRNADTETLKVANQNVVNRHLSLGLFPFGPAVDGDLVPDLPANLFKQGKHVSTESLMISHVYDEARLFADKNIKTAAQFTEFVTLAFPGDELAEVRQNIEDKYPSSAYNDNQQRRLMVVLRDSTFVCNNYQIYQAYKKNSKVYATRYEIPPAQHGSDLLAIIWDKKVDVAGLIKRIIPWLPDRSSEVLESIWVSLASRYQQYFAAHALTGDPNYLNQGKGLAWEATTDDDKELTNALKVGLQYSNPKHTFYSLGSDGQVAAASCDFWNDLAEKITIVMGSEKKPTSFRTQFYERLWSGKGEL
ncbi:putative carboxylesterase family protein [Botrytis fragariae]|uniref:Putative carboxylesterase family protein n=1 Tax=Botrytis fragariae TaxID=1964551 RepID=A0A8H6EIE4_9HELO|nr:putative carboxylesterase family protein [Botrytis fragariae]KAF5873404.1 putative carboxylesterase family protein [Botrytis fragariae]